MTAIRVQAIFLALAAPAGLLALASHASAQDNGASEPTEGPQCLVAVSRDRDAGVFDVAREEFPDGSCTCYVGTGPENQGATTEDLITAILESRECSDAPQVSNFEQAGGGGGGFGGGLAPLLGGASTLAGILILASGDDTPASP